MSSTSFVARSSSYFLPKMESHSSFHSEEESVDTPRSESPFSSQQCQRITRRLAIFVGSSNVPNSLVENREFQSLLEALDPRYPIPGRTLLGREIEKVLFDMKANIRRVLSAAQKVSLCADIWTKKV